MAEVLAIIPARGGSKGIPRKNVRLLAGKPLLAYSIEHARQASSVTRVVVSTDDDEIAETARRYGAEVVCRPPEISGDEAASESALVHVLDVLRDEEAYEPDLVVFLQATSPLRRPDDVEQAIETLRRHRADSLFSACLVHGFVWRKEGEAFRSLTYDYRHRRRRQDAPEDLIENGSIYLFKPEILRTTDNRLGGKITVYQMDPLDSWQIDEPGDFALMERLLAARPPAPPAGLDTITLLVLDFDGVLTDNRVLVNQDGIEAVFCHRGDGWGLARLREAGVEVFVLSTEKNPVVAARCRKLDLPYLHGCDDKVAAMHQLLGERGVAPEAAAFVGNDANDLGALGVVGWPVAVADAVPAVRAAARWVTRRPGGYGAVREVCDWILSVLDDHA